jgi:hypothetical protein
VGSLTVYSAEGRRLSQARQKQHDAKRPRM